MLYTNSFVKCLMDDASTQIINFAYVKNVKQNGSKCDLTMSDDSVVTIDCEFSILQSIMLPLLANEDLAGNAL